MTIALRHMPRLPETTIPGLAKGLEAAPDARACPDLAEALAPARAHEVCGPSRRVFAAMAAGRIDGPILWLSLDWAQDALHPDGLLPFCDPARIILARLRRPEDVMWAMEEALRSAACPLVVAEPAEAPGLTQTRRLHLAAEAGAARLKEGAGPRALLLTQSDGLAGAAQGIETRWRMAAAPGWREGVGPRWTLERLRARRARPGAWTVKWDGRNIAMAE